MNKARHVHEVHGLEGRVLVDGERADLPTCRSACICIARQRKRQLTSARAPGFKLQSEHIEAYFLSHFHGDHYDGLNENFRGPGLIHCTSVTAALVQQELGVKPHWVRAYDIGATAHVCGAKVTFLDANHCPGAAMLLFHLADGTTHLHCGDMRYDPKMQQYAALIEARGKIDKLYLDTTYCHPKHLFPAQRESIDQIADAVAKVVTTSFRDVYGHAEPTVGAANDDGNMMPYTEQQHQAPSGGGGDVAPGSDSPIGDSAGRPRGRFDCLVLLGAYKIGKERVLVRVAQRCGCKIYVDERKMEVLKALQLAEAELALFTCDKASTPVHVCRMGFAGELWPFFRPNFTNVQEYLSQEMPGCAAAVAFIPSGWAGTWSEISPFTGTGHCFGPGAAAFQPPCSGRL
jgi:hypothetical protein